MHLPQSICLTCRLRLFASVSNAAVLRPAACAAQAKKRRTLTTTINWRTQRSELSNPQTLNDVPAKPWSGYVPSQSGLEAAETEAPNDEEELEVDDQDVHDTPSHEHEGTHDIDALEALRHQTALHDPEYVATAARQAFGDSLPKGALNQEQYKIYERLYGPPLSVTDESETPGQGEEQTENGDILLREGEDGMLEEVEISVDEAQGSEEMALPTRPKKRSYADDQLQQDILASIQARGLEVSIRSPDAVDIVDEETDPDSAPEDLDPSTADSTIRAHSFTLASRSGTIPSTLPLPGAAMTSPVSLLLSNLSNKHLDEAAHRLFGGPGLPYSPGTPVSSRVKPQKPIPISPSQGRMTDMEADVYLAAVMPGTYAAITSALTEVRRRLGASWLEGLLRKTGGPSILDAGAGGAGVIAWREVLKAEWHRMHDSSPSASPLLDASDTSAVSDQMPESGVPPAPLGKATVLTSSSALRHRASVLLDNTTFLPRLPDYIHAQFPSEDSQRKQFDIIVAPHSLWHLQESYVRKQLVLNLWNLLNPKGGVLVLLEKGVPRGFEAVADARDYLLDELFEREVSTDEADVQDYINASAPQPTDPQNPSPQTGRLARRAPGRILAPCPNHAKCPMYLVPGVSRQRKDYCRFSQRYIRPAYLQRMLGAKERNYDNVEFSYVAVQKGATASSLYSLTGDAATDRAFEGYDLPDADLLREQQPPSPPRLPNPLPRIVLPPLKRQGHVHLDVCLPSGALERWTVPRSFGRQPYRDARKARWGDLWALGAKQRERRRVRLGIEHLERGIGTGRGVGRLADDGDDDEEGEARLGKRVKAKGKDRGRLKARKRRREETKAMLARDDDG